MDYEVNEMEGITKIKDIWKKDGSMKEYGWKISMNG